MVHAFEQNMLMRFENSDCHREPAASGRARCHAQPVVKFRLNLLVIPFCFFVAMILLGCRSVQVDPAEAAAKQSDKLYQVYLTGSRDQAIWSLEETIRVTENANLEPSGKANTLSITYARLYVLERRAGNGGLAEAALVRARYWFLREHELSGDSEEQAGAAVRSFTADKCMDFVDKLDKEHTDGVGPRYAQQ